MVISGKRQGGLLGSSQTAFVSYSDVCVVILAGVFFELLFVLERLATVALEVVFVRHGTNETPAKHELQAIEW